MIITNMSQQGKQVQQVPIRKLRDEDPMNVRNRGREVPSQAQALALARR